MYRCLIQTVGPVKVSYDSAGFDYLVECPDVSLFRAKGLADALAMAQLISDSMGDGGFARDVNASA